MRLILLVLVTLASCSKTSEPSAPPPTASAKDPAAGKRQIESGALVLDVRTLDEYQADSYPGAKHIPVDELGARMAEVGTDKSKPIVVYCASGNRAGKAKRELEAAGYTQVVNGGGLDDLR
ncbi:MAG: rhodanese-like domain-containing protein [Myxococcota bacterium]|nr:rhodanese-like domain-containing protein [Deltaproteobacteria bacterium]MDQ3335203.1 rhodanese-like domain-containing protein [Myxococcota bacterium]